MDKTDKTILSYGRQNEIKDEILFDGFVKKINDWLPDDKSEWD